MVERERARKNQRIWDTASMSPQKSNQLRRNWLGTRIPVEGEEGKERERDREPPALLKNNDVTWELAFRFYNHTHRPSHVCVCVRMCTYTLCSMPLMSVKSNSYTQGHLLAPQMRKTYNEALSSTTFSCYIYFNIILVIKWYLYNTFLVIFHYLNV